MSGKLIYDDNNKESNYFHRCQLYNESINLSPFIADFWRKFREIFKKHETFWHFNNFNFIARNPDDIKTILTAETAVKSSLHKQFFKHGLLVDSGKKYRTQRKTLSPLLQPRALRLKTPIINKKMDEFLQRYKGKLAGNRINATHITFKFISRIIAPTLFGVQREFEDHEIDSIRHDIEK